MNRRTLADRLILRPDATPLDTGDKHRREIEFPQGKIEVWTERTVGSTDEVELFVLKFSGQCGRAERATLHPAEAWDLQGTEVWAFNPPGYGGSRGPATLRALLAGAEATLDSLLEIAGGRPVVLTGNSLGSAAALHLAARYPVSGLILRNPPPLPQLVVRRHGWWNLYLPAMAIARQIPRELCSISSAARCNVPAIGISSQRDRVVPPSFQQLVFQAYAGPLKLVQIAEGGHASPMSEGEQMQYLEHLLWLPEQFSKVRA